MLPPSTGVSLQSAASDAILVRKGVRVDTRQLRIEIVCRKLRVVLESVLGNLFRNKYPRII